jgi:CBS-domain-containing membrane protein
VCEYPLAVGLAFFLMVALDVEHPPAAGTALAVAIHGVSMDAFVTTMVSAIIVTQVRFYLRGHLKDLV